MAYAVISDLFGANRYFENFAENLYGTNGTISTAGSTEMIADLDMIFDEINDTLRADGRFTSLPIQVDDNGEYPQALVDWNCYQLIYVKMIARFQSEFEQIPPSIAIYGSFSAKIENRVCDGGVFFEEEIGIGQLGIAKPESTQIGTATRGTFVNNYRGYPFGDSPDSGKLAEYDFGRKGNADTQEGYAGQDFPRTWVVEIDAEGAIGTSTYKWSKNGGMKYEATGVKTHEAWDHLEDNVWVRWEPDSVGSNFNDVTDRWTFRCVPQEIAHSVADDESYMVRGVR
mgnify:CR=1 FL=1